MNYQEFICSIQESLLEYLESGQKISLHSVPKNNGLILQGLVIEDPLINISPTIYMEPYYLKYLNDYSLEEICHEIMDYYHNFRPIAPFDDSIITDYNLAKEHIIMKLINRDLNKDLLEKVPFVPYLDLAIVFVCSLGDLSKEYSGVLIHHSQMQDWGITRSELYRVAKENTQRFLPYFFTDMNVFLKEYLDDSTDINQDDYGEKVVPLPKTKMYLLTNHIKVLGATALLYDGILEEISDQLNSSFILLPSSVHEVLIVPVENRKEMEHYSNMVQEVNATQLSPDEVLSDHAYYYSRKYKVLS